MSYIANAVTPYERAIYDKALYGSYFNLYEPTGGSGGIDSCVWAIGPPSGKTMYITGFAHPGWSSSQISWAIYGLHDDHSIYFPFSDIDTITTSEVTGISDAIDNIHQGYTTIYNKLGGTSITYPFEVRFGTVSKPSSALDWRDVTNEGVAPIWTVKVSDNGNYLHSHWPDVDMSINEGHEWGELPMFAGGVTIASTLPSTLVVPSPQSHMETIAVPYGTYFLLIIGATGFDWNEGGDFYLDFFLV